VLDLWGKERSVDGYDFLHLDGTEDDLINAFYKLECPEALYAVKPPLCPKIRKILFPLDQDEEMMFGTPRGEPDQLYRPMTRPPMPSCQKQPGSSHEQPR
jgi:hypothetical protein